MKKVLCLSGILAILLSALFLSGRSSAHDRVIRSFRLGNRSYGEGSYGEALSRYEAGLEINEAVKALNYNAAQAAFQLGEYGKALDYYDRAVSTADRFLNAGYILYQAGEASGDENEKLQFFTEAIGIYEEGIRDYPRDITLKYNYEFVRAKLEELRQDKGQEDESGDGEDESGNEDGDEGDSGGEDERGNRDDLNQAEGSEPDQGQDGNQSQDAEEGQDDEAIERILQMLENREEEDLKNNREVIGGYGDQYGW